MDRITIVDMATDVEDLRSRKKHETPMYAAFALAGEVGELCNLVKKEVRTEGKIDNIKKISQEIPDILFYLIQFCDDRGIDIEKEWNKKMKYNAKKYGRTMSRNVCRI